MMTKVPIAKLLEMWTRKLEKATAFIDSDPALAAEEIGKVVDEMSRTAKDMRTKP